MRLKRKETQEQKDSKVTRRARKMDIETLKLWIEALAMNAQHYINKNNVDNDIIGLYEARDISVVMADAIEVLIEKIEFAKQVAL